MKLRIRKQTNQLGEVRFIIEERNDFNLFHIFMILSYPILMLSGSFPEINPWEEIIDYDEYNKPVQYIQIESATKRCEEIIQERSKKILEEKTKKEIEKKRNSFKNETIKTWKC